MKVGRELDALVAEKVMQYGETEKCWISHDYTKPYYIRKTGFKPSSLTTDAWQVVEKFRKEGCAVEILCIGPKYYVEIREIPHIPFVKAEANTAPLAICIAALQAVGVVTEEQPIFSTASSLLQHAGTWIGDDLDECLQDVIESRGEMKI